MYKLHNHMQQFKGKQIRKEPCFTLLFNAAYSVTYNTSQNATCVIIQTAHSLV